MLANVYFVPAMCTIFAIMVVWIIKIITTFTAHKILVAANASPKSIKIFDSQKKVASMVAWAITAIILASAVIATLKTVVINETPQSTIDRSSLDQKQEARDRALRKEVGE